MTLKTSTAVVLVDLQNDFCHPDGVFHQVGMKVEGLDALIERVNRLVEAGRANGHRIVWVKMVWQNDAALGLIAKKSAFLAKRGLRANTWGAELLKGLHVSASDTFVEKTRFSGFYKTTLEQLLRGAGITDLFIGGVRTDFCVESTVRDAYFRDFEVKVVADTCAGYKQDMHEASLRVLNTVFSKVISLDEAIDQLAGASSKSTEQSVAAR